MKVYTFVADSATDAVAQIRSQLGAEAVVLNVRQVPAGGLARIWQKSRIEVLACLPDAAGPSMAARPAPSGASPEPGSLRPPAKEAALTGSLLDISTPARLIESGAASLETPAPQSGHLLQNRYQAAESRPCPESVPAIQTAPHPAPAGPYGGWRMGAVLENTGLLPLCARKVLDHIQSRYGSQPPASFPEEIQLLRQALKQLWPRRSAPPEETGRRTVVFIGAPGVGKTTCLCKLLAQRVLMHNQAARVWRLDGRAPNTAETLSVYCDILGVPLDRCIPVDEGPVEEPWLLVDLPGVNWTDASAVLELGRQLEKIPSAEVFLVLNAAYELTVLMAQMRAFEALAVTGLVFSHLDEELQWGKLWNFVLGSKSSLRYLSAGQNIPGDFFEASAERILSRQFVQ